MTSRPALYTGSVMHRRLKPRAHRFRYRAFWILFDLDALDSPQSKPALLSHNRFNLFSLYDRDHGDGSGTPLRAQIVHKLVEAGIAFSAGTIRLLCMPRTLGYSFNPLSVYYCAHGDGTLAAIVYEVHNTFGERHSYVLPARTRGHLHQSCAKAFYVSPFLDMDLRYDFSVTLPQDNLALAIRVSKDDAPEMIACLAGVRQDLTNAALLRLFFVMPAITLKVIAAIHWEAIRLRLKGMGIISRGPQSRPAHASRHSASQKTV
jgi:uncharacterized protein